MVKGQEQYLQVFSTSVGEEMEGKTPAALSPISSAREEPGPAAPTCVCPFTSTSSAKRTFTGLVFSLALFSAVRNDDLGPPWKKQQRWVGNSVGCSEVREGGDSSPWRGCSHRPAPHRQAQEL